MNYYYTSFFYSLNSLSLCTLREKEKKKLNFVYNSIESQNERQKITKTTTRTTTTEKDANEYFTRNSNTKGKFAGKQKYSATNTENVRKF